MDVQIFTDYDAFATAWTSLGHDETSTEQHWALLAELGSEEVLVQVPEWLAEEKVGYVEGATPTTFVGRIDRETAKAIRLGDSAAARPLGRLVLRIHELEASIERLQSAPDTEPRRLEWLRQRLGEKRSTAAAREEFPSLSDEWLPKSQLEFAGRRAD